MMGAFYNSRGMGSVGFYPAVAAAIPASGPAAPIVAAVVAGIGIIRLVINLFGSDPRKVPDTQVVEAAQRSFNEIWEVVSGEHFDLLFAPGGSGYDDGRYNVPFGARGNPQVDIDAAIRSANETYDQAVSMLLRPESVPNIAGNFGPLMARLNEVKRQRSLASASSTGGSLTASGGSMLPWLAAAGLAYAVLS